MDRRLLLKNAVSTGQDSQGLRRSGRAFDRQCLLRPGSADAPRTRRSTDRRQAARPHNPQLLGRHRFVEAVRATGHRKLIMCALCSCVSLACELQRDWARLETVAAVVEIVLTDRLRKEQ